jgi:hypothetical protein
MIVEEEHETERSLQKKTYRVRSSIVVIQRIIIGSRNVDDFSAMKADAIKVAVGMVRLARGVRRGRDYLASTSIDAHRIGRNLEGLLRSSDPQKRPNEREKQFHVC